jgi:glutamyl-tRNA synthetase
VQRRLDSGEKATWRLLLRPGRVAWDDLVRGPTEFHAEHLSDPVLVRADGLPLYTLSSVVDDAEFGITHIIRGEDHVANTAVQIQLFEALGFPAPHFAHFALVADVEGGKLSKRAGALSLESLRDDGIERMALLSLLAKIGTSDPVEVRRSLDALIAEFDIAKFGRARPKLDPEDLVALNAKLLHETPYEAVRDRLPKGATEAFWQAVRGNLERIRDAEFWWHVCNGPIEPVLPDRDFATLAARLLPAGQLEESSWGVWTQAVKAESGRKGKELFLPLRLALTGVDHGPELAKLLPLIGREQVLERLVGADVPTH